MLWRTDAQGEFHMVHLSAAHNYLFCISACKALQQHSLQYSQHLIPSSKVEFMSNSYNAKRRGISKSIFSMEKIIQFLEWGPWRIISITVMRPLQDWLQKNEKGHKVQDFKTAYNITYSRGDSCYTFCLRECILC